MGFFTRISQAPTHPSKPRPVMREFDVAELYEGPAGSVAQKNEVLGLDEKLRQAYFWIVNTAIISPYYDIEYNDAPPRTFFLGDERSRVTLPTDQSYSSFVLLPLLNLIVQRRCLLVGGPGRGKTASAMLMGLIAGIPMRELKRAIQHGQPQMTITDLLGNPLPKDLVAADTMDSIRIAWRKWLGMKVKIIDEYNRIPTRTQSALLTVMADNYAEILDQVYECPEAAWYLTANDDGGGGTYQVIEALRDRIDIVVKALHFSPRFLDELLERIETGTRPEETIPPEIIFSESEIEAARKQILAIKIPAPCLRRVEFFASQFEFFGPAADQFEYKTKDTVKLSGLDPATVLSEENGKDRVKDIGSQTNNGLSVRSLMTLLVFTKAMAYFRGDAETSLEDFRQILPFVLHDKLSPNMESPFFDQPGNNKFRIDRIGWLRMAFDLSCQEYDRLQLDRDDPVGELSEALDRGLEGVSAKDAEAAMRQVEKLLGEWSDGRKLYGPMFDDVLKLKYIHQRYSNYLRWLRWQKP